MKHLLLFRHHLPYRLRISKNPRLPRSVTGIEYFYQFTDFRICVYCNDLSRIAPCPVCLDAAEQPFRRYVQHLAYDQDLLCSNAAKFYGDLNYLHPFREGNGRTGRCFLNEIFRRLGFFFNACNIDKNKWDSACISSYTDQKASDLAALFKKEINVYPENKTKFIKYRKQFASEDFIETSPLDPIQFSDRTELLGNGGLGEKYSILKELIG